MTMWTANVNLSPVRLNVLALQIDGKSIKPTIFKQIPIAMYFLEHDEFLCKCHQVEPLGFEYKYDYGKYKHYEAEDWILLYRNSVLMRLPLIRINTQHPKFKSHYNQEINHQRYCFSRDEMQFLIPQARSIHELWEAYETALDDIFTRVPHCYIGV